jgi:protein SCO1
MQTLRVIRWAAIAAIVILLAAVAFVILQRGNGAALALTSMQGERVALPLQGKPSAMFFGFTHCPDVCPTTMQDVADTLVAAGDVAKDFRVFFITVDPNRDTPDLMKSYLAAFDPRLVGLTGTEQDIQAVMKTFGIVAEKVGEGDNYTFNHTASVLLLDAQGRLAGTFSSSDNADDRLAKLKRLLSAKSS